MAELFADLLGQPRAVALLEAALERRRIAPAYLFVGADGVGRRLAALRFLEGVVAGPQAWCSGLPALRRRLAQGNHPDLLWVEPTYQHQGRLVKASEALAEGVNRRSAPQIRLEQIRELTRFLARHPVEAPGGLVVLEGAEAMAEGAANALLKTLEEPGTGMLILICAAPDQLLSTIRSRCQQIPFVRLSGQLVSQVLAAMPVAAPAAAAVLAPKATAKRGAGKAAVSQSAAASGAGGVDEAAREPVASDPSAAAASPSRPDPPELLELAAGSPGALLDHRRHWRELPEGLAERLLALDRDPLVALALARDLSEALDGEQQLWLLSWWQLALWRRRGPAVDLQRLEQLRRQLRAYVQPRLAWEVALLEMAGIRP
ncbi:MAG: DNA polymerase III subunit delta' [Cyanobium sp.]